MLCTLLNLARLTALFPLVIYPTAYKLVVYESTSTAVSSFADRRLSNVLSISVNESSIELSSLYRTPLSVAVTDIWSIYLKSVILKPIIDLASTTLPLELQHKMFPSSSPNHIADVPWTSRLCTGAVYLGSTGRVFPVVQLYDIKPCDVARY